MLLSEIHCEPIHFVALNLSRIRCRFAELLPARWFRRCCAAWRPRARRGGASRPRSSRKRTATRAASCCDFASVFPCVTVGLVCGVRLRLSYCGRFGVELVTASVSVHTSARATNFVEQSKVLVQPNRSAPDPLHDYNNAQPSTNNQDGIKSKHPSWMITTAAWVGPLERASARNNNDQLQAKLSANRLKGWSGKPRTSAANVRQTTRTISREAASKHKPDGESQQSKRRQSDHTQRTCARSRSCVDFCAWNSASDRSYAALRTTTRKDTECQSGQPTACPLA